MTKILSRTLWRIDTDTKENTLLTGWQWLLHAVLGGILLASALGKSLDLPGFVEVLVTYRAFPDWSLWPIALFITTIEWMWACGSCPDAGCHRPRWPRCCSTASMRSG